MKGTATNAIKKIVIKVSLLTILAFFTINSANAQYSEWNINGNSNISSINYLGTSNPQPLVFKTNGAEWMRIDALGNVGIGTTIPQAKFEIENGSVLFDGTTGSTPASGAGTRMMWIPEKAAFRAGVVTGNTWNNGNIGISSVAFGINTTAKPYASFVIGRFNQSLITYSTTSWILTEPLFVIGNGDQQFPSNAMTVLKNGNVGITTTTPKNKLDVQGGIAIGNGYAGSKVAPVNGAIIRGTVGIGTATPTQKLEVNGNISVTGVNSTLLFGQEAVSAGNWGQWGIEYDNANHGLNFWKPFGSNNFGNAFLFIKDDGNVGIGVTNPVNKLEVCGTIRSKEWIVETGWCDFKLKPEYKRMTSEKKLAYILTFGHLPEIDLGSEIETSGLKVAKNLRGMIWNIEDNTMDIIDIQKENEQQKQEIVDLKNANQKLQSDVELLKKKVESLEKK